MVGIPGALLAGVGGGAAVNIVINAIDNTKGALTSVNKNLLMIGAGAVVAGALIAGALATTIKPASDLNESINAVTVAYGKNADAVLAVGANSAKSFGMSKAAFNEAAVSFSAFAEKIVGPGGDVVGTLEKITTRTADFASVMNLDLARAQTLMQAGLAGETEGLRRFGIDVSAASVKTFAYANGIGIVGEELTEAEKIQARYGTILEQTNKFQGDFANTSGDYANASRILSASIIDLKASLGESLLPILTKVIGVIQIGVDWFNNLSAAQKKMIVIIAAVAAGLLILTGVVLLITAATAAFTAVNIWWIAVVVGVIAIIVALVAAGVWLANHWDKLKEAAGRLGIFIQNVFINLANAVLVAWNFIVTIIEKRINLVVSALNVLIRAMNKIPGISIPIIPKVNLTKFKAEMMELKKFIKPVATQIVEEMPEIVSGASGITAALPTGPSTVSGDIASTASTSGSIDKATSSSSVSLGQLEIINTRIADGVGDLVILAKSREQRGMNIHIENINGLTGRDLANSLQTELNKKMTVA